MNRNSTYSYVRLLVIAIAVSMNFAFAKGAYNQDTTTLLRKAKAVKTSYLRSGLPFAMPPLKPGVVSSARVNVNRQDDKLLTNVQVYPNPVRNGVLTLEWFKGNGDPLEWGMYSITGQKVVIGGDAQLNGYNGKKTFDLSRMGIASGMYILKVVSGKNKWEFKIVYQ